MKMKKKKSKTSSLVLLVLNFEIYDQKIIRSYFFVKSTVTVVVKSTVNLFHKKYENMFVSF